MSVEVKTEDLGKNYGGKWVLDGVNLSVNRGEVFALMGPNGSGKSTLMKILSTIVKPSRGDAFIRGFSVTREADQVKRQISFLPEEDALTEILTGMENIEFFGKLMGLTSKEIKDRAKELLEEFNLSEHAKKKVGHYSKGMRRKLSIIIALLGENPVLLFDEPTSGLDPIARRELLGLMLRRLGDKTLIMNTHIGQDAEIARKVAFIHRGKIVAIGHPENLKKKYVRGTILHIKIPYKSNQLEDYLKQISHSGAITITDEGYRICVENADAKSEISKKSSSLGLNVKIVEEEPSLEDAFTIAVMKYEAE